ncbi:glycosyltransferase [Fulvivirga sp. 29W222]|uniref:Glycosyltransferase n=1 Tax=Fulvivirga marina TaxID=2494733 RepID=A0A937FSY9_9BACT|nr:glycosyltransferase [Fulvivirga marina]MBL6444764.1 glycosyltransferase [Fulvivirga marina]
MDKEMRNGAIFIVPRSSTEWKGNEAGWITASGWAGAAAELWGEALVATTNGVFSPQESISFPQNTSVSKGGTTKSKMSVLRKWIPEFLITAYKDYRLRLSKPKIWPIEAFLEHQNYDVRMVWERHDLFPGVGRKLARQLKVPFVVSVEAAVVWEAKKWGVNRPVWGYFLEKFVESASLRSADLVVCVSEELRTKVISMGVSADRVIVSHNRVNTSLFNTLITGDSIRDKYKLRGKKIIGWTGSFRTFHGLESVIKAFARVSNNLDDVVLMLVGDGLEFNKIYSLVEKLDLSKKVVFVGKQPFIRVPEYIASFDIALVSAASAKGFHYSPLKLREYLACGKPTIVPSAGDLPSLFTDEKEVLFYVPGDIDDLSCKMEFLLQNRHIYNTMHENAVRLSEKEGSWLHELKRVCEKLNIK